MKSASTAFLILALALVSDLAPGQAGDPYRKFNEYRAVARSGGQYPGAPLRGKVIGFASIFGSPFTVAVENGIKEQLNRAGLDLNKGWISMDNVGDAEIGLKNAQILLKRNPSFFIEFQWYPEVNNEVASMFGKAGIPVLAIDVPIPGAPFMGVDNHKVGLLAGHHMAKLIRKKWGGWEGVDILVVDRLATAGEAVEQRSEGAVEALAAEFGIALDDRKIVRFDMDTSAEEAEGWGMRKVLEAHPEAAKIALYGHNEPAMMGMIAAMQNAGRWDPASKIAVSAGADETGRSAIRDGLIDAAVAFFPEHYGEYIVPAVCAMLTGDPVPSFITVDNEIIDRGNIDRWYPRRK